VATGIIGLMFLVLLLMVFMKLGTKVKEEGKEQIAERVKAKQKEPLKKDTSGKEELVDLGKGINLDMVLIPAGKFMMGSTKEEIKKVIKGDSFYKDKEKKEVDQIADRFFSQVGSQHEVTITKPYYMGKQEVTQEQWEAVMGNNLSYYKGEKLPMNEISWDDCQEFLKKLNARTEGGYRLPTEAEWEYACRAGTTTAYSYGDNLTKSDANIDGDSIKEVGSYKPNVFGLYDMHGNVWEWCEDFYADYPAGAGTDPKGPATGYSRVLRGGSFTYYVSIARSSFRSYGRAPSNRYSFLGFRLARTP